MTLRVFKKDSPSSKSWEGVVVMDEKEANAARGGGNDIRVSQNNNRRFDIRIKNEGGDVEITHTTATNLVLALLNNTEAEYFLFKAIKDRLESGTLTYYNLWKHGLVKKEMTP